MLFVLQASARLLRPLSLLQARSTWTGTDLASRLEITPRTLRRDVDRLRSLGYPVESTTGTSGGYMLGQGAALPPLSLDEDEAMAVFVGLHTGMGTGGATVTGGATASIRALSKLERVLPTRTKRTLRTLQSSVLELTDRAPPLSLADVSLLAAACSERLVTQLAYRARGGEGTDRKVEPFRLVRVGVVWYLVAWDPAKDAWRTFRLDRIQRLATGTERFRARPPPGDDLVRYVTESLSSAPYPQRARVLLHAPIDRLRERVGTYGGVLSVAPGQRCILETGAPTLDLLVMQIARFGVDFDVLEPETLVRHVHDLAARLARCKKAGP